MHRQVDAVFVGYQSDPQSAVDLRLSWLVEIVLLDQCRIFFDLLGWYLQTLQH